MNSAPAFDVPNTAEDYVHRIGRTARAAAVGDAFTLVSFESEAAWRRHAQSRYVDRFVKKLLPICEGKPLFLDLRLFASSRKQWVLQAPH